MFYSAPVVGSAARITHTMHHCQLSVIQLTTNIKDFERQTDRQTKRTDEEKNRQIDREETEKDRQIERTE